MGLIVPNPSVPTDGQPVEATTLAANLNAVYQAIQSFDASQVASGTLSAGAFAASINPNTILHDTLSSFVYSGCVWTSVSGLVGTMSSGVAYIANATGMFRVSVSSVGSNTFTASKDTYIDIDYNGNITYNAVSNGASAPALTANSIRVAKVVTNGSAITSVVQSGQDSLGNDIYHRLSWLQHGPATATYANAGTTTSTSYTTTLNDSITTAVNTIIGPSGLALVIVSFNGFGSTNSQACKTSFAVSGTNTIASSDAHAVIYGIGTSGSGAGEALGGSKISLLTGLTAGLSTFTIQYLTTTGTMTVVSSDITVIPL